MSISKQRLKELERAELKLNALEAGGVDNWEGYDYSLEGYHAENELEEKLDCLIGDLEVAFGESAYEPSERGAGIAFGDDIRDEVMSVLVTAGVIFKGDSDDD